MNTPKTVEVTPENIDQFNARRSLLFFAADWHEPCQQMLPLVEKVACEFGEKVKVGRVDIYRQPQIAAAHRISRIPTLKFMKGGNTTTTHSGPIEEDVLLEVMQKFGA